jgi:hypothetical protein
VQKFSFVTRSLLSREISRFSAWLFLAATVAALAGCGSGGAGGTPAPSGGSTTPTPTGPTVASIELLASATQMPSSGANTVNLTAIVLDANKQAISGQTVKFSTGSDDSAFVNNISASGVSDANGTVTAQLNLGTDKSNRTITVSAAVGTITTTNSVAVTGTTVTISGTSSVAANGVATLTVSVKDSAGNLLSGIPVTVASENGNPVALNPTAGTTNSSGQITADITASAAAAITAGSDVITASAAGASADQTLTISNSSFTFTSPAANAQIPLGSTKAVSVNWTNLGQAQAGKSVIFNSSRGTVSGSPSTTNATGDTPGVTISSTTAGPAIITASDPSGTPAATLNVLFVATSASTATVQANPATVQYTTGAASQTNNSSTITVIVQDANANLVDNASVSFNLNDTTGGKLTSSTGVTGVTGSASVTYVAGSTSSAQNGVTVTATVNSVNGVALAAPVSASTTLTVAGQSLQVKLGTDNLVASSPPLNTKTYVAIVTDASGNPVGNATVQFQLRPVEYRKGNFVPDTVNSVWAQSVTQTCPNTDLNFNGSLDPGEAGLVTFPAGVTPTVLPGDVASVTPSAVTDKNGIATATVTYAKSYSFWVEETLEASTSVQSNTPPATTTFWLPGLAADYQSLTVDPPGRISAFGVDATCADTL